MGRKRNRGKGANKQPQQQDQGAGPSQAPDAGSQSEGEQKKEDQPPQQQSQVGEQKGPQQPPQDSTAPTASASEPTAAQKQPQKSQDEGGEQQKQELPVPVASVWGPKVAQKQPQQQSQKSQGPQQPSQDSPVPTASAWGPKVKQRGQKKQEHQQPQQQSQVGEQKGPQQSSQNIPPSTASAWGPKVAPKQPQKQPQQQPQKQPQQQSQKQPQQQAQQQIPAASGGPREDRRDKFESVIVTRNANRTDKKGTHGTSVRLTANYFEMLKTTQFTLFLYSVEFTPAQDTTNVKKRLVGTILRAQDSPFSAYVFDGTSLYSTTNAKEYSNMAHDDRASMEGNSGNVFIKITPVRMLSITDYQYIQLFNVIMRRCLSYLKLVVVGHNFYDANAVIHLRQHDFDLWPGYITSIRQHETCVMMCAEITHKVMRQKTAYDLLVSHQNLTQGYQQKFIDDILNVTVLTDYNNKSYKITDVEFKLTPKSTFKKNDGTEVSYVKYYKDKYNVVIKNLNQPLLVSKARLRDVRFGMAELIYLIPECCRLTGLTDTQKNDHKLMRDMGAETRMNPANRINKLQAFNKRLMENVQIMAEFKKWDMQLSNNLVQIQGRVLPPEIICDKFTGGDQADWTRELRDKPMAINATPSSWVVIYPRKGFKMQDNTKPVTAFIEMLIKTAIKMKFRLPPPQYVALSDDRPNTYLIALDAAANQVNPPKLIFFVLPGADATRYNAIKKKCCIDRAILSQVILMKNLTSQGVMSIATKVAIQMNAKLGGVPWTLTIPFQKLMVIGFDVCHDAQYVKKRYGAFVASLDNTFGKYYSTVKSHPNNEELSSDFAEYMKNAMDKYRERNNCYPSNVIFYRDGVGEGQLNDVIETEVKHLFKKCTGMPKLPLLTFVIVSKRINTRIFDNGNNPKPGTVVDSVLTMPERYDFYIVSQCVRQGTVSPTSYNVIVDQSTLTPDHLQRLTYKMTHMYFNWSGTVRVPAPCQYAHKLAFFASQNLYNEAHKNLETSLYYL